MTVAKAAYAREHLDDPQLERLQNELKNLRQLLSSCPFVTGSKVEETIGTSATRVAHRLGRAPQGCIVLKATPDAALGFSATQPNDLANAVHLEASASADFTLWFW